MRQNGAKVGSEALGAERKVQCPRCFAHVPASAASCPECGAPLKSGEPMPVADSAVHPELAQANLMRLRGDLDGAERKCLSILKRFPNEPQAHVLLGELSEDRGDWRRAIEWFELAVDLNPGSAADREKLESAKHRLEEAEMAQTVEQLGLPESAPKTPWIIALVAGIVLLAGLAAYATSHLGAHRPPPPVNAGTLFAPREETGSANAGSGDTQTPSATNENADNQPSAAESMPLGDRTLLSLLQKRSTEGADITSLVQDPRFHTATITYNVPDGEEARKIGATLAKDALEQAPDDLIVTVRGVSGDQPVFMADATRKGLTQIESTDFQNQNQDNPDAWMGTLLQNEWTPTEKSSAPTAAAGSPSPPPADSTTGSTAGATGKPGS